jgi:hypothetical protein
MFIAWDQRRLFEDTLAAMGWQRGQSDHHRIPVLWSYQYASEHDKVTQPVPKGHN